MKAMVCRQYGTPDVLRCEDVAKPAPKENEVLIKVVAASVNSADWRLLTADPFLVRLTNGLLAPKNTILGADVAGRVEEVGHGVTRFRPGDEVFGDLSGCGSGGFAEYVCGREDVLALKPVNLTYEEAAAAPLAAVTALQGLRTKGRIQPGQKVLIQGASGGVGTFAVQIAKSFGAEVTAVCSTKHVAKVRALGADVVIDYTKDDFTRNGQQYDLILAANGNRSLADYRRALNPTGTYVAAGGSMRQIFQAMLLGSWYSKAGGQQMVGLSSTPNQEDLVFVKGLLEAGKVVPVIDRCYTLSEVAEALRYFGEGHAQGKVVIAVENGNPA